MLLSAPAATARPARLNRAVQRRFQAARASATAVPVDAEAETYQAILQKPLQARIWQNMSPENISPREYTIFEDLSRHLPAGQHALMSSGLGDTVLLLQRLQIKFARGNDAGAYVLNKANIPEYDMFEIGDKILEVRRASSAASHVFLLHSRADAVKSLQWRELHLNC